MRRNAKPRQSRRIEAVAALAILAGAVAVWVRSAPSDSDGYYQVTPVADRTTAIREPHYYQDNVSYLIEGDERAVLLDTGPGVQNIEPIVRKLTKLPVTVALTHLHYDHVGNAARFDDVAMLDLPALRAQTDASGMLDLGLLQHLGFAELRPRPKLHLTRWLAPGSTIDLGKRKLQVLSTPGHTPESLMLYDADAKLLFTGDHIYTGPLLACLPGSSLAAYRSTTDMLLATIPSDARLLPGHGPEIARRDLDDLAAALRSDSDGVAVRVNDRITLWKGF